MKVYSTRMKVYSTRMKVCSERESATVAGDMNISGTEGAPNTAHYNIVSRLILYNGLVLT